jgi:hypothetical protein
VTPQILLLAGVVALGAGFAILLSFGPRYRVGRLLASAPRVSIGEALELARTGETRFVRVDGRIDSEEEFDDIDHRPLVLRRTRIEHRVAVPPAWRTLDLQTEAVPFQLNEGLDSIDVDRTALTDGLVVVPRHSVGVLADLGDRVTIPSGGPSLDTAARVTVEQVSSVEHAIAAGVPRLDPGGRAMLSGGLGRPLILTTLEIPEAMRVLTGGSILRSRAAAALLIGGGALLAAGVLWWIVSSIVSPGAVDGASPIPSVLPGSDTRSSGEGPGLVGNPAFAILGVVGIALLAILATLAYVRLTRPREGG